MDAVVGPRTKKKIVEFLETLGPFNGTLPSLDISFYNKFFLFFLVLLVSSCLYLSCTAETIDFVFVPIEDAHRSSCISGTMSETELIYQYFEYAYPSLNSGILCDYTFMYNDIVTDQLDEYIADQYSERALVRQYTIFNPRSPATTSFSVYVDLGRYRFLIFDVLSPFTESIMQRISMHEDIYRRVLLTAEKVYNSCIEVSSDKKEHFISVFGSEMLLFDSILVVPTYTVMEACK